MNRSSKTSTIGEWIRPIAKIGLMYASDYQMSLGSSSLSYTEDTNASVLKTGWMHFNNNVNLSNSENEWTISRIGYGIGYLALVLYSEGYIWDAGVNVSAIIRPVFYLTSDVTYNSGSGTYSDPYIINE